MYKTTVGISCSSVLMICFLMTAIQLHAGEVKAVKAKGGKSVTDLESVIAAAGSKCEAAEAVPERTDIPAPPFLTLYRDEGKAEWARNPRLRMSSLEARSAAEVNTLVCVRPSRIEIGEYHKEGSFVGPKAFRVAWDVRLVRASDGTALVGKRFYGSVPPESVLGDTGAVGDPPSTTEVVEWVRSKIFTVSLPMTKLQVQLPAGAQWSVKALKDRDRLENSLGMVATISLQKTIDRPYQCSAEMKKAQEESGGKLGGPLFFSLLIIGGL